ncbi:Sugar phosphate permease [Desulfonatronum thiosulfatophilum]|uniref:Lysosomal dipeptide transporter MFSD1 n=1 Tax=Desulfonatronum thiosulfatophilum TaxID=617002 RepID=A0A1G6BQ18_9BACT|nr:MFS transporter [Desulfonatronum thiosulfatophilum]SDB22703.1 Sugar phosphate permease [Desulfonatronum thiosulfatophilum]
MHTAPISAQSHPPLKLSWLIWALGASLYFMSFYQRVAPAVMTDLLMSDFQIGAAALGNFSAFYFYSYVAMQVPTGILADHWGPRRLLTAGALLAALGTIFFAMADTVILANIGRLLIGGSLAVAWVTLMKLAMHWFPLRMFAFVTGIGLLVGVIGAVTAGAPLRLMVDVMGWRGVMWALGLVILAVGIAIWIIVRDDPADRGYASYNPLTKSGSKFSMDSLLRGLGRIFRYRNTILLSVSQGGMVGTVLAFSGLWGVPYLEVRYGLSPLAAAALTSSVMIAWALSGPIFGYVSDRLCVRKQPYVAASMTALAAWSAALLIPGLPLPLFTVIVLIAGCACGVVIVGFAYAKESVPAGLAGTVAGVCNMGTMSGPMILQPLIGWLLDRRWSGAMVDGVRVYEAQDYQFAFLPMIGWLCITVILAWFTSETSCRPPRDDS